MGVELVTAKGTRYTPTPEDVLWLARAVQVEGAPRELVAQTLVNGFLWARDALGSKRTLAQWVRAYAQPVNPEWMPGGEHYEQAMATADNDAERERIRAAGWRRQQEHATRTKFSRDTQTAVEKALSAPPRLPGAVDYAAAWVEKPAPWVPFTPKEPGKNRFWSRPGAAGWTGYAVNGSPLLPVASTGGRLLPWVGVGALLLWALNRKG